MEHIFAGLMNELKDVVPVGQDKNKDCCDDFDPDLTTCMSAIKCNSCGWLSKEIPDESSADLY